LPKKWNRFSGPAMSERKRKTVEDRRGKGHKGPAVDPTKEDLVRPALGEDRYVT